MPDHVGCGTGPRPPRALPMILALILATGLMVQSWNSAVELRLCRNVKYFSKYRGSRKDTRLSPRAPFQHRPVLLRGIPGTFSSRRTPAVGCEEQPVVGYEVNSRVPAFRAFDIEHPHNDDPGHVFVTQGDLTKISADAVLYPTRRLHNTQWFPEGPPAGAERIPIDKFTEEKRVHRLGGLDPSVPQIYLGYLNKENNTRSIGWYLRAATQFLMIASHDLKNSESEPKNQRTVHLLALPVIGTGVQNAKEASGELLSGLLTRLYMFAAKAKVDIVLVVRSPQMFSAAQATRWELERRSYRAQWSPLPNRLITSARRLAELAKAKEIVFFIGAGVSSAGGLPNWKELLVELAKSSGLSEQDIEHLSTLSFLDQAKVVEQRLEKRNGASDSKSRGSALQNAVVRLLSTKYHSMMHSLLANIPVDAIVTTNYDTLFEDACEAAHKSIYAIPYEAVSQPNSKWILKLHGDVNHPEDIVLTREQVDSYDDRRKALSGIVQALLITKHMLFIGFSLQDENFHKVATTMRTAFNPQSNATIGVGQRRFGTVLALHDRPFLKDLWPDLHMLPMDGQGITMSIPEAARLLEIFLDRVSLEASTCSQHLLDRQFSGPSLSREEWALKLEVEQFMSKLSRNDLAKKAAGYEAVIEMIQKLGGNPSDILRD